MWFPSIELELHQGQAGGYVWISSVDLSFLISEMGMVMVVPSTQGSSEDKVS